MSESPAPALEIDNLTCGYGSTVVLRDVSLKVEQSSIVALLGANGAGKTTLLKAIAGLLPVKQRGIRLGGRELAGLPPHRRQRLGLCYIPEGRGIFRSLTVRENLALTTTRKNTRAAVEAAVSAFPVLGERLSQTAGTMSGGEQQMLAMAQACVTPPNVLLVDEASLGLAPIVVDSIFDFLVEVNRRGTSVLLVDQFVVRALEMATFAYVLQKGEVIFSGPATELKSTDLAATYFGA